MSASGIKRQVIKIIFGGECFAGRTQLISVFMGREFSLNGVSTIGTESSEKKIKLKNGDEKKLFLLDTAGQERFRSLQSTFFKISYGAVIAFDLTDRSSFDNVLTWLNMIKEIANYPIVLFGCK